MLDPRYSTFDVNGYLTHSLQREGWIEHPGSRIEDQTKEKLPAEVDAYNIFFYYIIN